MKSIESPIGVEVLSGIGIDLDAEADGFEHWFQTGECIFRILLNRLIFSEAGTD